MSRNVVLKTLVILSQEVLHSVQQWWARNMSLWHLHAHLASVWHLWLFKSLLGRLGFLSYKYHVLNMKWNHCTFRYSNKIVGRQYSSLYTNGEWFWAQCLFPGCDGCDSCDGGTVVMAEQEASTLFLFCCPQWKAQAKPPQKVKGLLLKLKYTKIFFDRFLVLCVQNVNYTFQWNTILHWVTSECNFEYVGTFRLALHM